jgi:hypothetical protein
MRIRANHRQQEHITQARRVWLFNKVKPVQWPLKSFHFRNHKIAMKLPYADLP